MAKKKEKVEGWQWSDRFASDTKRAEIVEHRKAKEIEGLSNIMNDLWLHFDEERGDSMVSDYSTSLKTGYSNEIQVTMGKDSGPVCVGFRYRSERLGHLSKCLGVKVRGRDLGRAYGFDFEKMRMTPEATRKLAAAIKECLQGEVAARKRRQTEADNILAIREEVETALVSAGYKPESVGYDGRRVEVAGISLTIYPSGRIETRTEVLLTNVNDIVRVVKAIEALKAIAS